MDFDGFLWCGFLWISMDFYGFAWPPVTCPTCACDWRSGGARWISIGFLLISIEFYWFLQISIDFFGFLWISMDFYWFLWISIDFYIFLLISMDIINIWNRACARSCLQKPVGVGAYRAIVSHRFIMIFIGFTSVSLIVNDFHKKRT